MSRPDWITKPPITIGQVWVHRESELRFVVEEIYLERRWVRDHWVEPHFIARYQNDYRAGRRAKYDINDAFYELHFLMDMPDSYEAQRAISRMTKRRHGLKPRDSQESPK